MADDKNPGPKKKFISDQDMWEMSLDMVGDESIDPTHRSPDAREVARRQKETLTSRAKTAPLKKPGNNTRQSSVPLERPVQKAVQKPVQKPVQNPAPKATTPSKPPAVEKTRPVQKPVAKAVTPQPPVQRRPEPTKPAPVKQVKEPPVMARPQRSQPVAKPAVTKQTHTTAHSRSAETSQQTTRTNEKREPAKFNAEQSQPAVFTTRDVDRRIAPQNLEDLSRKKRKEKFIKVATSFWALFDFTWVSLVRLAKFSIKAFPVVWRNKVVVSVGVVCFTAGYFTASIMNGAGGVGSGASIQHSSDLKSEIQGNLKSSVITKTTRPKSDTARIRKSEVVAKPKSVVAPANPIDNQNAANQFSGRDILIEEVGGLTEAPVQDSMVDAREGQPDVQEQAGENIETQSITSGETSGVTPDNVSMSDEPIVTERVEPQAAITAMFDKKIQQIDGANTASPSRSLTDSLSIDKPLVVTDEIKDLLQQDVEAYRNKEWQRVIEISEKIIAIEPRIIDAYINRSVAHTELGMIDEAISDSNKAILLNPKNPLPINNRGYAYEKAGAIDNAIADYQAACNLGVKLSCQETERLRKSIAPGE